MRKILSTVCMFALCAIAALCFAACGGAGGGETSEPGAPQLSRFTGITLADQTVTYDGQPHSLAVAGTLPEGTDLSYRNNGKTDAGTYTVTATLKKANYEDKTLTATLTINKATFTGITLADKKFVYLGTEHSLTVDVEGELPAGTVILYSGNNKKEVGVHDVTAMVTNPNYETLFLHAKMTITAKTEIAKGIVDRLIDKPDPWAFIPAPLRPASMASAQMPVGGFDGFSSFVDVDGISEKTIGKQFHVLYEGLNDTASLLSKVDTVYAVATTIADAYQTFINNNPDNYAEWTGSVAGFKIKITLDGDRSVMLIGNSTVSIELGYDSASETRTGRIQVTDGAAVKYEATPDALKLAVKITAAGVGNVKQIEFARSGDNVAGYLKEFTGGAEKNIKTSGAIAVTPELTAVMSDKRESDDLAINGYEEVYSSVTGEMIGGRVLETVKLADYDTVWLHLRDVGGIDTVKVVDEKSDDNDLNADSVYVNGQNGIFKPKKVGGIGTKMLSRRFDIEMKEVWYVVASDDNKTEYKLQKTLVPMLRVQKEMTDSFSADVKSENPYIASASLSQSALTSIDKHFETLKALFDTTKTQVTYADVMTYIGENNAFFEG